MNNTYFFKEDSYIDFRKLKRYKKWINQVSNSFGYVIKELNYIFCSDEYLHKINMNYLNHDTYTDIITFDLKDSENNTNSIEADIFISTERVEENAKNLGTDFEKELARVMAHGVLHIIGLSDKTDGEKLKMRKAEDRALQLL